MSLNEQISKMLASLRDQGAEPEQIAEFRRAVSLEFGWNPTKKRLSSAKRRAKRKAQKLARRANRGKVRGQANRKGQRFTLNG